MNIIDLIFEFVSEHIKDRLGHKYKYIKKFECNNCLEPGWVQSSIVIEVDDPTMIISQLGGFRYVNLYSRDNDIILYRFDPSELQAIQKSRKIGWTPKVLGDVFDKEILIKTLSEIDIAVTQLIGLIENEKNH